MQLHQVTVSWTEVARPPRVLQAAAGRACQAEVSSLSQACQCSDRAPVGATCRWFSSYSET